MGMIDHKTRKKAVIAHAIRLFAKHGYQAVTFRELSKECGVARTVLYRYFRNKRQIFDLAISLALERIVQKHAEIVNSRLPAAARLQQICMAVTATLFDNREFLAVIIDFVMAMRRDGHDMTRRIMKFTIGLKRVMHTLIMWGVRRGEFREDTDADICTDLIYSQFESAVLRLTLSGDAVMTDIMDKVDIILKGMLK